VRTHTKLREWRIANDYTLREMAALTGLSDSMLSLAERGLRQLSPRAKVTIARRLGEDVGDLFELEPVEEVDEAVAQ